MGTVDLNDQETVLHILGHLDVVDPGEGWTVTEAFVPKLVDGLLYGRGTDDDKGPVAAALLAMKAVKDLGIPLRRNVRLIAGTDEETGFRDVKWYYSRHPYAPYTISPDADFPIINIEKGHYQPTFQAAWPQEQALPRVSDFTGGTRLNMSSQGPGHGFGSVSGHRGSRHPGPGAGGGHLFLLSGEGTRGPHPLQRAKRPRLHAGRGAQRPDRPGWPCWPPWPLADCPSTRALRALHALFPHGDHHGQALGIAQADDLSGPLTLAFTMLTLHDTGCQGRFDSRTPLCGTEETICRPAQAALTQAGFTVQGPLDPPHHVPADSPFLQVLAKCYEQYSGRKSQCLAIGGGTYVHDIPGGVAFGASMPGFVSNLHGPDERVHVGDLLTAAKIYAQVILALCA